jgi:DNA polymerase-3 subunit delta
MKLRSEQLATALQKHLGPVYLLSGDEPFQLEEAADLIRKTARSRGFLDRELFFADGAFDWSTLAESCVTSSLFAERRILDVRLVQSGLTKEAAKTVTDYLSNPADDVLLMISAGKLSAADQKSRWFQAIDRTGIIVQFWPLEGAKLLDWLDQRMNGKGMLADRSGLEILAARVEGNLLAAAQEIDKLFVLYGMGKIEDEMIRGAVADSARYDVFDLSEAALDGDGARVYRVLAGLRQEGVAPAVTLWALTREVRLLINLVARRARGESVEQAFSQQRIWNSRRDALMRALQRLTRPQLHEALVLSAAADRIVKGAQPGEPWNAVLTVCLQLAGMPRDVNRRGTA